MSLPRWLTGFFYLSFGALLIASIVELVTHGVDGYWLIVFAGTFLGLLFSALAARRRSLRSHSEAAEIPPRH